MQNFIEIYSDALSSEECNSLVKDWGDFTIPGREDGYTDFINNNHHRNDEIILLGVGHGSDTEKSTSLKKKYFKAVESVVRTASNKYLSEMGQVLTYPLDITGYQLQKSTAARSGGYHTFHYECAGTYNIETIKRSLAWMIYLNDIPVGEGETEFLYQGLRVQPKRGDLVVWPAQFTHTHRGNPVYTTDKYVVTGWLSWPEEAAQRVVYSELMKAD